MIRKKRRLQNLKITNLSLTLDVLKYLSKGSSVKKKILRRACILVSFINP